MITMINGTRKIFHEKISPAEKNGQKRFSNFTWLLTLSADEETQHWKSMALAIARSEIKLFHEIKEGWQKRSDPGEVESCNRSGMIYCCAELGSGNGSEKTKMLGTMSCRLTIERLRYGCAVLSFLPFAFIFHLLHCLRETFSCILIIHVIFMNLCFYKFLCFA